MRNYLRYLVCLVLIHGVTSVTIKADKYVEDLMLWAKINGGRFNHKVEIRRSDPDDPTSRIGLFASEDMRGSELILSIPRKLFLTVNSEERIKSALPCETVSKVIEEIELGEKSEYYSWMNYLKNQEKTMLPSAWSQEGKTLLKAVIDELRPAYADTWIDEEWYTECKGEKDAFKENIALMVVSRSWDYTMVPVFEIMNHRNGPYLNTFSDSVHSSEKDVIQIRARRRIQENEEILTSYNMCQDCENRNTDYGTPEILRDYGFVEDYPQRWIFDDILKFEIRDNSSIETDVFKIKRLVSPSSEKLHVAWIGDGPLDNEDKVFLAEEIARLQKVASNELKSPNETVPKVELDVIMEYHNALLQALTLALENFPAYKEDTVPDETAVNTSDEL